MSLENEILRTPLIPFRSAEPALIGRIFLKPENLQPFGSYKIRGIASVIASADQALLRQGLHAGSAGNMAQPVAYAARTLGVSCRIYVPENAPEVKKAAIRALGADLLELPYQTLWGWVRGDVVLETTGIFIHPTLTTALHEGYGAIAREIIEDLPEVDAIVVPFGVGGLTLGITAAVARLKPGVKVFTVEPETAAPMAASLTAGRPVAFAREPSFVDAIGVPEVLPIVFEALVSKLAGAEALSIQAARQGVATLYRRHRLVVEGAGGCAVAAAETLARRSGLRCIAAILSGGNIEDAVLQDILSEREQLPADAKP